MSHLPVSKKDESIRLFRSDFLEFFSHISPAAITIIWAPVAILFFVLAVLAHTPAEVIAGGMLIGLFLWTLAEYLLHRFVFHFKARSPRGQRITFLFHGVHHAYPQDKTRLVMPPPVSIPLALIIYGLFYLVVAVLLQAGLWLAPMFTGFIIGYLVYDLTHYATHHIPMRSGAAKWLKRYHMKHHYKSPDACYGVSSPLWDYAFGTTPKD